MMKSSFSREKNGSGSCYDSDDSSKDFGCVDDGYETSDDEYEYYDHKMVLEKDDAELSDALCNVSGHFKKKQHHANLQL